MNNNTYLYNNKIPEVKHQKYIRKKSYILINSKDRDQTAYVQPQNYVVNLPTVLKNVESVRLVSGTIPDLNSVRSQPFLILDIAELNNTYTKIFTTSGNLNVFDIIRFSDHLTTGTFNYIQSGLNNFYKPVLAKLSRLTINIRDQYGVLFDFGDDTVFNNTRQNSFVFEVTELVHNTYNLDEQIIF